jgi:hypothetical protein
MRLADIETRAPALPPGENAYPFVAEAVTRMRWPDHDSRLAALICPPPMLGPGALEPPSAANLARMCALADENRAAVEMVDRAIAMPAFVAPPMPGDVPETERLVSVACRANDLSLICCLDARCLSLRGRLAEAGRAIDRLFRFGSILLQGWQDFGSPPFGMLAKQYACLAALESAADPRANGALTHALLHLAAGNRVPFDVFVRACVAPFLRAVAGFFGHLGDRTSALVLLRRLLRDIAFRHAITSFTGAVEFAEEDLAARERGDPPPRRALYPTAARGDEEPMQPELMLSRARMISRGCELPFDKEATMAAVEDALSAVHERRDEGPVALREYLESAGGTWPGGYRLAALLRAAAGGASDIAATPAGLMDPTGTETSLPGAGLARNVVGTALAADILCAYQLQLSFACDSWQLSAMLYDVYLAALAVVVYTRSHGVPPPSLEALGAAGYLADVPRDAYLGRVVNYDRERLRLFLDAEVSAAACCGEPPTAGWEASWYVHLSGREGRANGGGG